LDRKDKEDNRKREKHLSIDGKLEKDRLVVAELLSLVNRRLQRITILMFKARQRTYSQVNYKNFLH